MGMTLRGRQCLFRNAGQGTFVPYDVDHPDGCGLTKDEVHKFHLSKAKPVSYEHGILMTSGQNKGAMLLVLLHQAKDQPEAIVYDDDNIRHVANVYTAAARSGQGDYRVSLHEAKMRT